MTSNALSSHTPEEKRWLMPVLPENYDRRSLSEEEHQALKRYTKHLPDHGKEALRARELFARFERPVADLYFLRHQGKSAQLLTSVQSLMRREMARCGSSFWQWDESCWQELLCSTVPGFRQRYGKNMSVLRMTLIDAAYLFGGVTDLRSIGIGEQISETATVYFGQERIFEQCQVILAALRSKGYSDRPNSVFPLRYALSMLFLLARSPYLEDIGEDHLVKVAAENKTLRLACGRIRLALEHLHLLPSRPSPMRVPPPLPDSGGMAPEWYAWCLAWYERAADLSPRARRHYLFHLTETGRWLQHHYPEIRHPWQWTEDLALHFRADVCSWTNGQYASEKTRSQMERRGTLGTPQKASNLYGCLVSVRRFLSDLIRSPHSVPGEPAQKIRLDFSPREVLIAPKPLSQAKDAVDPRDVDMRVWAKLVIAAATLSESDISTFTRYPLSFFRALALVWVTSARRTDEIVRLRLDCVREDWDPLMFGEDGRSVESWAATSLRQPDLSHEKQPPKLFYLHIPSGKNRGPFWIWIPDYVAAAIDEWRKERPSGQRKLPDRKDQEYVDYLFCSHEQRVGSTFLNHSLIPTLCAKAGVSPVDARGRITGHRGRSTRLTLLRRNGVSLDDLAEYAGHKNTQTIRRYARQDPLQLHRIIKDADDMSRIIEGVVDVRAAAAGLLALRWFIGYDANGEPQYCANQVYHTCPHRLDCAKCGMFIGGEQAKLLHQGENVLPITSKVPMTPIEKCEVNDDQAGVEAQRAALEHIPAPETPTLQLIFNPEGLSNHELEKLAEMGTLDALEKLRQALAAHEQRLAQALDHKTGRSALVGAQKKRVHLLQRLAVECERRMNTLQGGKQQTS